MEYSLYINQVKAVEWELSMGEALLFSYLINSAYWMKKHPESPDYVWCANSKLANELPLVCKHKGSAKRHMAVLEDKGIIRRMLSGNKSYFMITNRGAEWKSKTLPRSHESVPPEAEKPPKQHESVPLKPHESVPQSDIPINQIKGENRKKTPPPEFVKMVLALYAEILPELQQVFMWDKKQDRAANLAKIWKDDSRIDTRSEEFWRAYFEYVRTSDWWMGRSKDSGGNSFACSFEFLVRPKQALRIIEGSLQSEAACH